MTTPDAQGSAILAVVSEVLAGVRAGRDERALFEALSLAVATRLGFERVALVLGEPFERRPRVVLSRPDTWLGRGRPVEVPTGVLEALRTGSAVLRELPAAGAGWPEELRRDGGWGAYLVVPLAASDHVVGAVAVGDRHLTRLRQWQGILEDLTGLAAAAVRPARLMVEVNESLRRLRERATRPLPDGVGLKPGPAAGPWTSPSADSGSST